MTVWRLISILELENDVCFINVSTIEASLKLLLLINLYEFNIQLLSFNY